MTDTINVPIEPTPAMLDVAVSHALMVSLSVDYTWTAYMRDVWKRMLAAAPVAKQVVMPVKLPESVGLSERGEYGAAMARGFNACIREVARLNAADQEGGQDE